MQQRVLFLVLFLSSFMGLAADTALKLYRPFEGNEPNSLPIITHQLNGSCSAQSQLIVREDAWRCYAEGKTFDPCFASADSKQKKVLCPSSPWSKDNVQINVSEYLDNTTHQLLDMSKAFPWGIELSNGEQCQAIETGEHYDSMPVHYRCLNQHILFGTIQRCDPAWSMLKKDSDGVATVHLKTVWF